MLGEFAKLAADGQFTVPVARTFPSKTGARHSASARADTLVASSCCCLPARKSPASCSASQPQLSDADDAGAAFFGFFASLISEGAANRGLADALTGAGFDIKTAASRPEHDVMGALSGLLARAQQAGSVRRDIDGADVIALVTRCLGREPDPQAPAVRDRLISVFRDGLRPGR